MTAQEAIKKYCDDPSDANLKEARRLLRECTAQQCYDLLKEIDPSFALTILDVEMVAFLRTKPDFPNIKAKAQ